MSFEGSICNWNIKDMPHYYSLPLYQCLIYKGKPKMSEFESEKYIYYHCQ